MQTIIGIRTEGMECPFLHLAVETGSASPTQTLEPALMDLDFLQCHLAHWDGINYFK